MSDRVSDSDERHAKSCVSADVAWDVVEPAEEDLLRDLLGGALPFIEASGLVPGRRDLLDRITKVLEA